ncbi:group II intron maturase-specific domain-containing protein [Methylobacterium sp. 17Sr1-1]|uniref:group II intron reverse transcriptase n=1 Tax=Methylobacterium sp. 17Sr1-1 TaxID=2202826 RepID=UPI0026C81098
MFTTLIRRWLKAGAVDLGRWSATTAGTPQGGPLSPLLANVALDGMERLFGAEDARGRYVRPSLRRGENRGVSLIRYADDLVVTAPTQEVLQTHVVPALSRFLGARGLQLSEAKTRIVHIDDGVDFLGFTVRRIRGKVLTRSQKAKVVRHLRAIGDYLRDHRQASPSQVIAALNPVIRGWTAYYRHGASKHAFHTADHHVFAKLWRWAKRRHPTKAARWVRSRYFDPAWNFVDGKTKLVRHDEVGIVRHAKVQGKRSPLNPDDRTYWQAQRRRRRDETMRSRTRATLLRQQDYRCALCGVMFDPDEDITFVEVHHDTPRHCSGTDRITNLKLVHRWCHKAHHARTMSQAAEA